MAEIVADETLPARLKALTEPATVVDEAGNTLGHYQPMRLAPPGLAAARSPHSREELGRRREEARKHPERGRKLSEFWADMEKLFGERS